ncbi:hypothetical protein TVAG_081110 [Trichomonas vaginalis G3]|uniref:RRM domain-containing protein n=1 Tax=Trichomonas vaginalis (strain ATCC PRA-98 / G3) TaxID=412133 RepID=A2EPD4_TRIV3|nr:positive regulation of polynucleotide adenylyltransferase protein [Trichomonas vaginalis G3]EAY05519.1 hypothetical protein TVAG_081110 [Trichomonas vaginalis G3]KAI5507831.1 positive regulation of polynucleotide adenylyltransferase protein [Trichomonas vaginalis G3]|eukprot:XP_001317742.1 hypothetical protein [Trichomonas vaginalis G3]
MFQSKENCVVLVKGLSFNVRASHANEIFKNYGHVNSVEVAYVKGHSTGWAYVHFSTPEEAQKAIDRMDGGCIDGCTISVTLINPTMPIEAYYHMCN